MYVHNTYIYIYIYIQVGGYCGVPWARRAGASPATVSPPFHPTHVQSYTVSLTHPLRTLPYTYTYIYIYIRIHILYVCM